MQRKPIGWMRVVRRQMLWLPLVPLLFAAVFGTIAWYQAGQAQLLDRHGVETFATVTDRQTRTQRNSDGDERTEYLLSYRFDAGLGEVITGRQSVDRALYLATAVGDQIPLRYVAHHPDIHEIESGESRFLSLIFGAFAALFGAVGLGLGLWMVRRKASLIRAARDGEVRQAEVLGHQASSITVNDRPLMQARWRDAAGETGVTSAGRTETLPPVGAVIVVYIDPISGRGWWEGDF